MLVSLRLWLVRIHFRPSAEIAAHSEAWSSDLIHLISVV